MKRLSLICLAALGPAIAMADIVPTGTTVTGTGPYVWTYNLQLAQGQSAVSGLVPSGPTVSNQDTTVGSLFTLYDFDGYVGGSCTGPGGWACTAQSVGITPSDALVFDDPGIFNLTWVYTSGDDLSGIPDGYDLGEFTAWSIYNTRTTVSFAGRGVLNDGELGGAISENVGLTVAAIPEPGSLALAGLGLLGVCLVRRRKGA